MAKPKPTYEQLRKELASNRAILSKVKSMGFDARYSFIINDLKKTISMLHGRVKDYRSSEISLKKSRDEWKSRCEQLEHEIFMIKTSKHL